MTRTELQQLAVYSSTPNVPLPAGQVAYAPMFAWLLIPFALLPARAGFAVWTGINFLAALSLAWRAAQFFPARQRLWVIAAIMTSLGVVDGLLFGEVGILLGCAAGEAYLCFRDERDVRAGLWISVLLIKPIYGLLVGPLLIWKRRWGAVAGAAAGSLVIGGLSLLVAGPSGLLGYPNALGAQANFDGAKLVNPQAMINWRGAIVRLLPNIDARIGLALTVGLGAATVAAAAWGCRGPWRPRTPGFARQMALLWIATLIVNYHSHIHGIPLLILPLAELIAVDRSTKAGISGIGLVFLPTLVFLATLNNAWTAWAMTACMLTLFGVLLWQLRDSAIGHRTGACIPRCASAGFGTPVTLSEAGTAHSSAVHLAVITDR